MRHASARKGAVLCATLLATANARADESAINPATGAPVAWGAPAMDGEPVGMVMVDRLETASGNHEDHYAWDAESWYGSNRNRLWLKTEGEGLRGSSPDEAELQLLYARLLSPFFMWQAGIRRDFPSAADREFFVLGLQGLAPYGFELDSALFVSNDGDVSARLEAEYDILLTQRLVLTPRLELNLAFADVPALNTGSGINGTDLGLRLRYEVHRKLAPYLGVGWTRLYGKTADWHERVGEASSNLSIVAGLRAWF